MTADTSLSHYLKRKVPAGFRVIDGPGRAFWILRIGPTLPTSSKIWDGWTRGEGGSLLEGSSGRGPVYRVNPDGVGPSVLRAYRHGGILRRILADRFLGTGRFLDELRASEWLRSQGVPTPEVFAFFLRRGTGSLFRGWILTRYLSGGINLRAWVQGGLPGGVQRRDILRLSALTVGSLHEVGCFHRDLNLSNLLLSAGQIHLLDLDGARLRRNLTKGERGRNLFRLYRSLAKETGEPEPLAIRERAFFLRVYSRGDEELFRSLWRYLSARWSFARIRRAFSRSRKG